MAGKKPKDIKTEEMNKIPNDELLIDESSDSSNVEAVGLDVGTMNLVAAYLVNDDVVTKRIRNMFVQTDAENAETMDLTNIFHAIIEDQLYILGDDAYNFANIFGQTVRRPMKNGMISPNEIDALDILTVMIKELIGHAKKDSPVCFSIPANPIDADMNVTYHKNVLERIVTTLGYKAVPFNEAAAIVLDECAETNFSGIGISFGAGMTNVAIVYKSVPVVTFSVARGGDWIDYNAAISIGQIPNRVSVIKERPDFDLTSFEASKKKERRIREALVYYYKDLLNYVIKNLIAEFNKIDLQIPDPLPIIVAGGTSKPKHFVEFFKEQFENFEVPFEWAEIRHAENPLTAVASGCLVKALQVSQEGESD